MSPLLVLLHKPQRPGNFTQEAPAAGIKSRQVPRERLPSAFLMQAPNFLFIWKLRGGRPTLSNARLPLRSLHPAKIVLRSAMRGRRRTDAQHLLAKSESRPPRGHVGMLVAVERARGDRSHPLRRQPLAPRRVFTFVGIWCSIAWADSSWRRQTARICHDEVATLRHAAHEARRFKNRHQSVAFALKIGLHFAEVVVSESVLKAHGYGLLQRTDAAKSCPLPHRRHRRAQGWGTNGPADLQNVSILFPDVDFKSAGGCRSARATCATEQHALTSPSIPWH
jgi:hypothetical protein